MQAFTPILLDASLKGLAILLLTAVASGAMRKSSAAARHLVWTCAVVATLAMPILSFMLPGLAVLPAPLAGEFAELARNVPAKTKSAAGSLEKPGLEHSSPETAPLQTAASGDSPAVADADTSDAARQRPVEYPDEPLLGERRAGLSLDAPNQQATGTSQSRAMMTSLTLIGTRRSYVQVPIQPIPDRSAASNRLEESCGRKEFTETHYREPQPDCIRRGPRR